MKRALIGVAIATTTAPTKHRAAFLAVQSGFLLSLVNEARRGDSTEFQRMQD